MPGALEDIKSLDYCYTREKAIDNFLLISILFELQKEISDLREQIKDHIANKKMHEC